MSKGTLFHHFATLDAIPLAATELLATDLTESVDPKAYKDARGYLRALGRASLRLMEENAELMKALNAYLAEAFFNEGYREAAARTYLHALDEVRAGLAAHGGDALPRAHLDALATSVAALLDGMSLHALLVCDNARFRKAWPVAADAFAAVLENARQRS